MDKQIDPSELKPEATGPYDSGHLMCRTSLWGIAGFLGCAYFAWVSFSHVIHDAYDWPHDGWTAATYIVWIVLLVGLGLETRCWRERSFFGILVVNFLIGFGLTVWHNAPVADVRLARIATGGLWTLAAILSLTTIGRAKTLSRSNS
jgi:hypothetical protein